MKVRDIYISPVDPNNPRIEIQTGISLHVMPLGKAKRFATDLLAEIAKLEAESKPESSLEAGDASRLARIIEANPGAELRVDNDNWHLVKPKPVRFDDWDEGRQEAWWENDSELCASRDFPSLEISRGYGILSVMAGMLGITMGEY